MEELKRRVFRHTGRGDIVLSVVVDDKKQLFIQVEEIMKANANLSSVTIMYPMLTEEKAIKFVNDADLTRVINGIDKHSILPIMLNTALEKAKRYKPKTAKRQFL